MIPTFGNIVSCIGKLETDNRSMDETPKRFHECKIIRKNEVVRTISVIQGREDEY